jgi:ribosomal protein L37E
MQVVKGAIEDMFMWVDKRGGYHTLFHLMYGCDTCGSHAYSVRDQRVGACRYA